VSQRESLVQVTTDGLRTPRVACVTGATGIVGNRIVEALVAAGWHVRALSRKPKIDESRVHWWTGGLESANLDSFLSGAEVIFHSAAELRAAEHMWRVNVEGTERLVKAAADNGVRVFCYISSAGVVGRVEVSVVDENTTCNPAGAYEESKYAGECSVFRQSDRMKVISLRPTNVVDGEAPGILWPVCRRSVSDIAALVLKGAELSHVVHAEDVAKAALYLESRPEIDSGIFLVSYDTTSPMTMADAWRTAGEAVGNSRYRMNIPALPVWYPHLIRQTMGNRGNRGDVVFSGDRLLASGFRFSHDSTSAVRHVARTQAELRAPQRLLR